MRAVALAPRILEYALAALLAFLLVRILLSAFAPLPTPRGDALAAATGAVGAAPAVLEAKNPFPKVAVAAAPEDVAPDVADTSLDLVLRGAWPGPEGGSAIIQTPDARQNRYAVGDEIVAGARLSAVYADQVIIDRAGAREALRFENKSAYEPAARATEPTASAPSPPTGAAVKITDIIRIGPGRDAAGNPGFALSPGADRGAFARLGFEEGDILRRINGARPPANPGELAGLIERVAGDGGAELVVERDGTEKTISISLNDTGTRE